MKKWINELITKLSQIENKKRERFMGKENLVSWSRKWKKEKNRKMLNKKKSIEENASFWLKYYWPEFRISKLIMITLIKIRISNLFQK